LPVLSKLDSARSHDKPLKARSIVEWALGFRLWALAFLPEPKA
jgi:hypothetical protein